MSNDFKFYQLRMRELKQKFGMDSLQVDGLPVEPKPRTLSDAVIDKEHEANKGWKLAYGHTYSPVRKGPVRLWYSTK
jgi:hypothetical protein